MVRNLHATTAAGLRKNRVTQKTRLRVVRGELDDEAILIDDEEERNRVVASQGVDAEDANEHHLQAALSAASHCGGASGRLPKAHIPTPDAADLVEAYESLYRPGQYKQPTTHLRFSKTVEEIVESGLAGGFTYFLDERDAEWIDKNTQEAREEGTSAHASTSGVAEDASVTAMRGGRSLHSRGPKGKGKEPEQPAGNDHTYSRIVLDEDEFELVMGLFEKFTEEKFPFIHLALDAFPPFSDYEPVFAAPLSPATFARYQVPPSVPPPERLVVVARAVYPHWKDRKIEREGKRIVPQLDFDEAHESSYNCFRRRDPKPVRRTRASSSAYTDKLVRLRSELQVGLGLAKTVLEREGLKRDGASATRDVWLARCKLVDAWKSEKQGKGPGMGVDEALLFDKERVVKKPGRIILGLNRRPSGAQSGSGTPIGDPHSPLTAHLDLSAVNLSTLSPQAYVAVQSAARERYRDMQAGVEKEMASMRTRDIGWEDLLDMPYQALPVPYPDSLFKPSPPLSRPATIFLPNSSIGTPPTHLNDSGASSSTLTPDPTPFPSGSDDTSAQTLIPPPPSELSHQSSQRPFSDGPVAERVPRSLRLRTGRGGRLHLDRRLHVRRPHPLLSVARAGWPRQSSLSPHVCRETPENDQAMRWEGRDWCPERGHAVGKVDEDMLGEEYWAHESLAADGTSGRKRKRPVDEEEVEEETVRFRKRVYGPELLMCTEWEKGPAEEGQLTPEPRARRPARKGGVKVPEPERWRVDGQTAEGVEHAWRVAERWRYDSDVGREEEDRFLLDDYQPKFMRTTVTLLDANDHEAIETDPMDLTPPLIPKSRPSVVQPPSHLAEPERVRLTNMRAQLGPPPVPQPQPQSQPQPQPPALPSISHQAPHLAPSTTPPLPPPLPPQIARSPVPPRMDEQIRRMARQPRPSPESLAAAAAAAVAGGPPQTSQRISPVQQQSPSTPTPAPVQVPGPQLKPMTFANGMGADGGATVRVSSGVRPKSHTPSPQQQHGALGASGGFAGNQHQHQHQGQGQGHLALHAAGHGHGHGHGHGLNPHQYATLRNVFAERVPGAPARHVGVGVGVGVAAAAGTNVSLQMGPGNLNLKLPARVNGDAGASHGRASPLGHAGLPMPNPQHHHHSGLGPLHHTAPARPSAHQQMVGGAGQGHGYS